MPARIAGALSPRSGEVLDAGDSPPLSAEGVSVWFDGVIFDAPDRDDGRDGATLVAHLYRRHGFEGAIERINGDFAIALHDPQADELWLARDRFGVRPMYFVERAEGFAFGSMPRALAELSGVDGSPRRDYVALVAASHYRYFDNRAEWAPYEGVHQLRAGHLLVHRRGATTVTRYWDLTEAPDLEGSEEELAAAYRDLLLDAVAIRVRALPNPTFTLSGGMDSSSVLAAAARALGGPQPAWSTVYADETYDESEDIVDMRALADPWYPVPVDEPNVLDDVAEMVALHDEPVATATWLSHRHLIERVAGAGFTALVGGLGGDELNAGEYEYFPLHFADLRVAGREDELGHEIERWAHHHDHPIFRKGPETARREISRLADLEHPGTVLPDRARLERYAEALCPEFFDLRTYEPRMDRPFASYLKNRAYQDLFRETLPCCLRAQDRHGAAFGVDTVSPFLDHRLAELMFRIRGDLKVRDGVTKRLLREAMRGILPEATRTRVKKTGWNAPAHIWFSGDGRDTVLDLVRSQRFRDRGIYNVGVVERIIDEHDEIVRSGRAEENHMMFLWQLVNLDAWLTLVEQPQP